MNRPRLVRALRIIWTAFWAIAAILLVGLWLRSYQTFDDVNGHLPGMDDIVCSSASGRIMLSWGYSASYLPWSLYSADLNDNSLFFISNAPRDWFVLERTPRYLKAFIPHGFVAFLAGTFAVVCWLPIWFRRFSVRKLLVATTLVAAVLGLILWTAK